MSRLEDGACLIRIDGPEALRFAQPYIDGAFALARGATLILLDLRANGGGTPETLAYVAGRLLGDKAEKLANRRTRARSWVGSVVVPRRVGVGPALFHEVGVLYSTVICGIPLIIWLASLTRSTVSVRYLTVRTRSRAEGPRLSFCLEWNLLGWRLG